MPTKSPLLSAWDDYLASLPAYAIQVWNRLVAAVGDLSPPHTAQENGLVSMAWDSGRRFLEIEIFLDGSFDWFYWDRISGETEDGEGVQIDAPIPHALIKNLRELGLLDPGSTP